MSSLPQPLGQPWSASLFYRDFSFLCYLIADALTIDSASYIIKTVSLATYGPYKNWVEMFNGLD